MSSVLTLCAHVFAQERHLFGEALECYREALRISRAALGSEHPTVAVTLDRTAQVFKVSFLKFVPRCCVSGPRLQLGRVVFAGAG